MNIDFLATVNKTSGTLGAPSSSFGTAKPGFREEINQAMRDNDRKCESAFEKKPVGNKKPVAASETRNAAKTGEKSGQTRNSVKTGAGANAPKTINRPDREYADNKVVAAEASDHAEETSEDSRRAQFASACEDSGFHGELEEAENSYTFAPQDAENSETENPYMFAVQDVETSETENSYMFIPQDVETSETENSYSSSTLVVETPTPEDIADASVSFPLFFSSLFINDDSRFATMMNIDTDVETAGSSAGLNATQNENILTEVISNITADRSVETPTLETTDERVPQNASLSDSEGVNDAKELLEAMSGELETADVKSTRPEAGEILEYGFLPKDQVSVQNADRASATSFRSDALRNEIQSESKTAVNADIELSEQSESRASSENEAQLMERLYSQATKPRENGTLANASENAGKTVQFAEASVQAASNVAKAEAPAPPKPVNMQDQEFIIELAGRIQAQIRGGREMIRIQLHPEDLGRLEIRAESGRNGIIARIAAETTDVKKLLENNLQSLQQTLEARGLKIDRLHIVVEDSAYAAFADAGRYGHAGTGPRNAEMSEFSRSAGAGIESLQDEETDDLTAEAEQRGVGFYTVG